MSWLQPSGNKAEIGGAEDDLMRSLCTLLGVLTLLFMSPLTGAAHAQTGDPLDRAISALKGKFAEKSSVLFSRKTRQGFGSDATLTVVYGKHRFAANAGVRASDVAEVSTMGDEPVHFRMINIGRDTYTQGTWADVPKGKKWLHWQDADGFLWSQNLVDALNPKFLRLISRNAEKTSAKGRYDGVSTTRYDGLAEVGLLGSRQAGIYYGTKDGDWAGGRIKWKLWLGPDNLPRRFQAEIVHEPYGPEQRADTVRMNVLYRGWGTPVRIQAPSKNLVAEAG
ncbi:hypothetical protein GCM10027187_51960 [Streptosporangium sandarakinum]|uniref:DUF2092 domain-containing protein n=1 Tax=Streptosporangium sandarakinum TaxID=1260955 RepID=A0A852UXF0_9ACTN|nr:hypothetical protein [Streptosporangium sandarakinum]NYF40929.1 hypothetical protein [Streptosporangium sandarakinum]